MCLINIIPFFNFHDQLTFNLVCMTKVEANKSFVSDLVRSEIPKRSTLARLILVRIILMILVNCPLLLYAPPPPPPSNHNLTGSGSSSNGGGAPLEDGLYILFVCSAAYLGWMYSKSRQKKKRLFIKPGSKFGSC